ncbi:MAG: endonuclease III domain-containing protein [Oscillospiraceae bacterium]|jgi:endonuclease-3 related protein|nr:endonuclease III domain-containing protein [Oscillospiraceae bacterium]
MIEIYNVLFERYGDMNWWPANTPYEVIVGAVLTQNTTWNNVKKALDRLGENINPKFISEVDIEELSNIIRPAGFFNQKAIYLKEITSWFGKYNFDIPTVCKVPLKDLRKELLAVKGVGRETADSILLYACDLPTFVVDAYTKRLCQRIPIEVGMDYEEIKAYFENNIPKDVLLYNNFHALIVNNAKEHCRKKPLCEDCPLFDMCKKTSINF